MIQLQDTLPLPVLEIAGFDCETAIVGRIVNPSYGGFGRFKSVQWLNQRYHLIWAKQNANFHKARALP